VRAKDPSTDSAAGSACDRPFRGRRAAGRQRRLFDERMGTRMGWLALLFVASCMGTYVSARGAFASREDLRWMLDAIGSEDPLIARIACVIGLALCPIGGLRAVALAVAWFLW
jgi:hypothetical protein